MKKDDLLKIIFEQDDSMDDSMDDEIDFSDEVGDTSYTDTGSSSLSMYDDEYHPDLIEQNEEEEYSGWQTIDEAFASTESAIDKIDQLSADQLDLFIQLNTIQRKYQIFENVEYDRIQDLFSKIIVILQRAVKSSKEQ